MHDDDFLVHETVNRIQNMLNKVLLAEQSQSFVLPKPFRRTSRKKNSGVAQVLIVLQSVNVNQSRADECS